MGGIFGARTELIGPAEAEIWCSEVDLCSHGVVGWGALCLSKKRIKMYWFLRRNTSVVGGTP